jgi:hypothetical protein
MFADENGQLKLHNTSILNSTAKSVVSIYGITALFWALAAFSVS